MENLFNPYTIPTLESACADAQQLGHEDGLTGSGNNAPALYIPDSPEWHAYAVGYLHGQRRAINRNPTRPRQAAPQPDQTPGLWALRGYEDALFERPQRLQLPDNAVDRDDYQQGYIEGADRLQQILSAPPPTTPPDPLEMLFYRGE